MLRSALLGLWETRRGALLTCGRAEDWRALWGAVRDNGRHRRRPTRGMIRDKTALRVTRGHKAIKTHRAMFHPVKPVTSGGGAASLLSMAGRIAWRDTHLYEAFSCPWTSPATCDTLRDMARGVWQRDSAPLRAGCVVLAQRCERPDSVQLPPCAERTGPRAQPCQGRLRRFHPMSACPHRQLVLVRETHARLRCRHCHLTITAGDLAGRYCPECFETTHTKRYDFDEVQLADSSRVAYRCEACGSLITV